MSFQNSYGNMTYEQCAFIVKQPCYYCGQAPATIKTFPAINERTIYNYIDCRDPDKPRTVDNCVACCSACKNMRNHMQLDDFLAWVKRVYEYRELDRQWHLPGELNDA